MADQEFPFPVTLKCWSCGATKSGVVDRLPNFAFEVVHLAEDAGWIGIMDFNHGRSNRQVCFSRGLDWD